MIDFLKHLVLYDVWLKLFSLALAILIWLTISFAIRGQRENPSPAVPLIAPRPLPQRATFTLPVMVLSAADDPRALKIEPKEVEVTVEGDSRRIGTLQKSDLRALVDLSGIEAANDLVKRIEISKPAGINEVRILPPEVKIIIPAKTVTP
jgi:hypothetical protein